MGTIAKVVEGSAIIYTGAADAYATTAIGYTEDGVLITYTPEVTDIEVNEETFPIGGSLVKEEVAVALSFAESEMANMNLAMSGADDGTANTIKLGGGVLNEISVVIEADAPGGTAGKRLIIIPKVHAVGAVGTPYKKGEKNLIPAEFRAKKPTTGRTVEITDVWEATIAAGEIAHLDAKGGYRVEGQDAAADDLDDITGGSDGDEIVIRIKNAAHAITVKHVADTIELTGAVDFVMNDLRDWLHLKYSVGATEWIEQARFDASA